MPITTLRHIIQQGDGSFTSFLSKAGDGNQLDLIRQLETQVKDLQTKLDFLEKRGAPVRDLGTTKTVDA